MIETIYFKICTKENVLWNITFIKEFLLILPDSVAKAVHKKRAWTSNSLLCVECFRVKTCLILWDLDFSSPVDPVSHGTWHYRILDSIQCLKLTWVGWVLWHINLCRLFNTNFNCQKYFYFKQFSLVKQFKFKQFILA